MGGELAYLDNTWFLCRQFPDLEPEFLGELGEECEFAEHCASGNEESYSYGGEVVDGFGFAEKNCSTCG